MKKNEELRNRILKTIKKIASVDGTPPGQQKFERITKIKQWAWCGVLWARWSDALREAGFEPNTMSVRYSDEELLEQCAQLALASGRIPSMGDHQLARTNGAKLANWFTIWGRFGGRKGIMNRLKKHCIGREDLAAVLAMCETFVYRSSVVAKKPDDEMPEELKHEPGFVYLMKSTGKYKIGKAACVEKRYRQIATMIPVPLELIHFIKVEDALGVEAFWHRRFKSKRVGGEWFELDAADVEAFKGEGK